MPRKRTHDNPASDKIEQDNITRKSKYQFSKSGSEIQPRIRPGTIGKYCPMCDPQPKTFYEDDQDLMMHMRVFHPLRMLALHIADNTTKTVFNNGS